MSIEVLSDAAASAARARAADAAAKASGPKRITSPEEAAEASRVSLKASKEMQELVRLVAQAPVEVPEERLEDIAGQVRDDRFQPGLEAIADRILEELRVLPDPPYDTLP